MKDLIQDFSRERFLLFLGLRLSATTLLVTISDLTYFFIFTKKYTIYRKISSLNKFEAYRLKKKIWTCIKMLYECGFLVHTVECDKAIF